MFHESILDYFSNVKAECRRANEDMSEIETIDTILNGLPDQYFERVGWVDVSSLSVLEENIIKIASLGIDKKIDDNKRIQQQLEILTETLQMNLSMNSSKNKFNGNNSRNFSNNNRNLNNNSRNFDNNYNNFGNNNGNNFNNNTRYNNKYQNYYNSNRNTDGHNFNNNNSYNNNRFSNNTGQNYNNNNGRRNQGTGGPSTNKWAPNQRRPQQTQKNE